MTYKGIDLTQIIAAIIAIIGMLLARAQTKLAEAEGQKAAYARLGVLGLAIVADLWDALTREFQTALADGSISTEEREHFKAIIAEKIEKYTSRAELEKLAGAANLPVPGIIAWLAEFAIDRLTAAHNPANTAVSEGAYPIRENDDALRGAG